MAAIFLDLYGVLADGQVMDPAYTVRMAEILHRRYGGSFDAWCSLQRDSFAWYQGEGAKLDARPGPEREGDAWVEAVRRMNGDQVRWMFERANLPLPADPVRFAEDLEAETVRGIDALYPDARRAVAALRSAGHRLFLSTNANRSNAESALIGGGVRDLFDGLVMLETGRAKKDRAYYWRRAFEIGDAGRADAWAVDDVARFLTPAAELGARCVQLIRSGMTRERGPYPVIASLAALPDLVDG